MKEIWKEIPGYDGIYEISNYGQIKSKRYWSGSQYIYKDRILKQWKSNSGYFLIGLNKNKKEKRYLVHRLVAQVFIENKNNYKVVNHINGNKQDNRVENLEWCTQSYNEKEAFRLCLIKPITKAVSQYDLDGNFIIDWKSIAEAERKTNSRSISACCRGERKTAGGYIWKFKEVK